MPIGKNAIKRISNNGYSNVQTNTPDMENSEVIEKVETAKEESLPKKELNTPSQPAESIPTEITPKDKKPKKKVTKKPPTAPKKSLEKEPELAPVNTLKKLTETNETKGETNAREGAGYVNVGGKLPDHLL